MIEVLDTNKDGKVSYFEFCEKIACQSDTKAITDSNHWAFGLFE